MDVQADQTSSWFLRIHLTLKRGAVVKTDFIAKRISRQLSSFCERPLGEE
jgi:hypothetical protein